MSDIIYMISEASKLVHVESHVLRYWEDELELDIPRNELGHRFYTQEHIHLFQVVKVLKEKGYQLRAIKELLPHLGDVTVEEAEHFQNLWQSQTVEEPQEETSSKEVRVLQEAEDGDRQERLQRFEELISDIVVKALEKYELQRTETINEAPVELSEKSIETIMERMEAALARSEEREEERYRLLDESIRTYQRMNQQGHGRGWKLFGRRFS